VRVALSTAILLAVGLIAAAGTISRAQEQAAPVEMVGPLTQDEILQALPGWQDRMAAYTPRIEVVSELKNCPESVQVEVYRGTWCSDSRIHVPAFFQVLNSVDSPRLQASFIGLPRDKKAREPYIVGKDIVKLPTFIVLVNGLEKGRIIETPERSVEEDLLAILNR